MDDMTLNHENATACENTHQSLIIPETCQHEGMWLRKGREKIFFNNNKKTTNILKPVLGSYNFSKYSSDFVLHFIAPT